MLKTGTPEQIRDLFNELTEGVNRLVDSLIELTYFMRGSVSYEEMLHRTPGERDRMHQFLQKRFEHESKSAFPNY